VIDIDSMPRRYDPTYEHEDLISQPWARDDMIAMDERFAAAMRKAGFQATAPSTQAGTTMPVAGYQRPD